jgi:hypothetical protein
VPTFADRKVSRGQRGGSLTVVNISFLDRNRYVSFKYLFIYPREADWPPFQTHSYSEILVEQGIELGTSELLARNSGHLTTEAIAKLYGNTNLDTVERTLNLTRLQLIKNPLRSSM